MYDAIIIGAGPVGLAIAIELARRDLAVLVLDRRPPLASDARVRPQLLVARAGDLAALAHLGLDVEDDWLVSLLASRTEADLATGRTIRGDVLAPRAQLTRPTDLWALARQPPLALVPIGRLQLRLLEQAERAGAEVRYGCEVTKLRRHARAVSLTCADGQTELAAIAIIATGAARALIGGTSVTNSPDQRLLSGVFATSGPRATWLRAEVPVAGHARPVRCTMLQTPAAGTALLVDPQLAGDASPEQLHRCFDAVATSTGLAGAPFLAAPQVFTTAVSTVTKRSLAGDGRAPVVIAGDAAQTGHVFSGSTCFVNLALALGLCDQLAGAKTALIDRAVGSPALLRALARYDRQSELGAAILAQASARHTTTHPGQWALAGVARA
jgi:2-polyprenyl-6-methoxyphenol hydroxylase-like FAD-dependent oxidoreductase